MKIALCNTKMPARPAPADGLVWYSPAETPFRLAGFPWFERDHLYRRMPYKPVPPLPKTVEELAWHTAGGQVAFKTDSTRIAIKVRLRGKELSDHMPATGRRGFDLYRGNPGRTQYVATTRFNPTARSYDATLRQQEGRKMDTYTIHFPLCEGIRDLWLGLDKSARVLAPPPYAGQGPVIIYGTSITQGGCASRPGMAFPNILGRRLNRPVINMGFSGSARLEPEVAHHLADASAQPALLMIDADANCGAAVLRERLVPFVEILRQSHPQTPILIVSRPPYALDLLSVEYRKDRRVRARVQDLAVRRLRKQGDRHIHFLDGFTLIPEATYEATVDGVHLTDLGFWQVAVALEPVLRRLLARDER